MYLKPETILNFGGRLFYAFFLVILNCFPAPAMEIIGQWGTGYYHGVDQAGTLTCCAAAGAGVDIFRTGDPTRPTLLSNIDTPGICKDVFIDGYLLYAADSNSGLEIIDISDPTIPVRLRNFGTFNGALKVQVVDNKAYVIGYSGLEIIDVSDPEAPVSLGHCDTPGFAEDLQVVGTVAYIADNNKGLQIVDISDPRHPEIIGNLEVSGNNISQVSVTGQVACLADQSGALHLVNIAIPATPRLLTSLTDGVEVVESIGNTVYYGYGVILKALDISDPANPAQLGAINLSTPSRTGSIKDLSGESGSLSVTYESGGLVMVDFNHPNTPVILGGYNQSGVAKDVQVSGNQAYLATGYGGLQILDISDPVHPRQLSNYPGLIDSVEVAGNLACLGEGRFFSILEVSDPRHPVWLGHCQTDGLIAKISIDGDYAYVAGNFAGIQAIDISDPQNPFVAATYKTIDNRIRGIDTEPGYIFAADGNSGLEIYRSEITAEGGEGGQKIINLVPVGSLPTPGFAENVHIIDATAYIADSDHGLQIISINRPARPRLLGSSAVEHAHSATDVQVVDHRAYLLEGSSHTVGSLQIIDISDPGTPALLDSHLTSSLNPQALRVVGNQAYIADGDSGRLLIMSLSEEIHDHNLYIPHVACAGGWKTEICFINLSPTSASGELNAYDDTGSLIPGSVYVALKTGQRTELDLCQLTTFLSKNTEIAYLALKIDNPEVVGYTKFYHAAQGYRVALPALRVADRLSQLVNLATDKLYVTHIASDLSWWTGIALLNTTETTELLTISFSDNSQKSVTLNPGQHKSFSLRDLFGAPQPQINSAVINGTTGVIGFELFGSTQNGSQLGGITLNYNLRDRLCYPHIASDNSWWTGFAVYEPSGAGTHLTLTSYNSNGVPHSLAAVDIAAGQKKFLGNNMGANLPADTAWLEIAANRDITGFELFGDIYTTKLAGYAVAGIESSHAVFPKIDQEGGWAGIALINPYDVDTTVDLMARDDLGKLIAARRKLPLLARTKIMGTPAQIFPGADLEKATYISYRSNQPLIGFQLNSQGLLMDALPALSR